MNEIDKNHQLQKNYIGVDELAQNRKHCCQILKSNFVANNYIPY